MHYAPNQPDPEQLRLMIWKYFEDVHEPKGHFTKQFGATAEECGASDGVDLETATIEDIKEFYDSNTFYTPSGYKYRFPRMFSLLCRLGPEAARLDFVSTFFRVNLCCELPDYFADYTDEQRYCVWLVYDCLDLHFGDICLFDYDAKQIVEQRDCGLEVVDSDAVETLSMNLFGTSEPPLEALKLFGETVCVEE